MADGTGSDPSGRAVIMRRPATADRMWCISWTGTVVERRRSVDGLCLTDGLTDVGIAQQTARYQEAVSRTPQMA